MSKKQIGVKPVDVNTPIEEVVSVPLPIQVDPYTPIDDVPLNDVTLKAAGYESEIEKRLAFLEHRVDMLYRYTVGDKTSWRYPTPNSFLKQRGDEFPDPDYDAQGGPRRPASKSE